MIPSHPFTPNNKILPTANHISLTKLRINQEKRLSVAIKLLPMQNHETNFIPIAHNLFRIAPFEWQRNVSLKLLDEHFKQNEIRLLCVQPTGGCKTLLYQKVASHLKGVCI